MKQQSLNEWILASSDPARFLSFGCGMIDVEGILLQSGWVGVAVRPLSALQCEASWALPGSPYVEGVMRDCGTGVATTLVAQIGPDPHFVLAMREGAMVRAVTVEEVLTQFGSDWAVVLIDTEAQNLLIFKWMWRLSPPRVIAMREHHYEEIQTMVESCGCRCRLFGDVFTILNPNA